MQQGHSHATLQIALYQPDIPQNLGAIMRLCACFSLQLHIIEPCGFPLSDSKLRRSGMDYIDQVRWQRHIDWGAFEAWRQSSNMRLLLLTTKASSGHTAFHYQHADILLLGRESAGVPEIVHQAADVRLRIPMQPGTRSLNMAMSAAIVASEALRQLGLFSDDILC